MKTVVECIAAALSRYQWLRDELARPKPLQGETERQFRLAGGALSDLVMKHLPRSLFIDIANEISKPNYLVFRISADPTSDGYEWTLTVTPSFIGSVDMELDGPDDASETAEEINREMFLALTAEISLGTFNSYYVDV